MVSRHAEVNAMTLDTYIEYLQEIKKLHGGSILVYRNDLFSVPLSAARNANPPSVTNLDARSSRTKFVVSVTDELGERVVKI
jgi:hypothetical protein